MKAPKGGESIIFAGSDGRRLKKVDARAAPVRARLHRGRDYVRDTRELGVGEAQGVTTYIREGKSPKYSTVEKYPVIAQKCNQWSGFSVEKARFIDPATVSKYADERILKDGDLLWNSTGLGTLGRMAVYDSAKNRYGWAVADNHVTVIRTREGGLIAPVCLRLFRVGQSGEDQASGSTKQKSLRRRRSETT